MTNNKRNFDTPQFTQAVIHACPMLISGEARNAEKELFRGLEVMQKYAKSITFFGSARLGPDTKYYKIAESLAAKCAKLGFAVVSGGGPGIMQAANKGAFEAGGVSIGFNIELPMEQSENPYLTESVPFEYFFTRKTALTFTAEAFIDFPGGFGTYDETFQVLCHIQTRKMPKVPVILVGSDFWGPLHESNVAILDKAFHTINPEDVDLYTILDDEDEIMKIVAHAPVRDVCKEIAEENFMHEKHLHDDWNTLTNTETK